MLDIGLSRCAALLFFVSRCVLDGTDAIGLLVLLWYIYIDACVLAPLATVSCSIQIDLVVFVHTAYGVEHILDPQNLPKP